MITTGIHVIDSASDTSSIPLLINRDGGPPLVVSLTPLEAIELGTDILEAALPEFTVHPSGLGALSDWSVRLCGITEHLVAALPSDPHVIRLLSFIAGRVRPAELKEAAIGQLDKVRSQIDALLADAKVGEND